MICPTCGNELKNDAKFCTKCGSNVESTPIIIKPKATKVNINVPLISMYAIGIYIAFAISAERMTYYDIAKALQIPEVKIGLIFSCLNLIPILLAIPIGFLLDRNKRTHLLASGIFMFGFASILIGFSNSFYKLLFFSIIAGIGSGFILPGIISYLFDCITVNRRGIAIGFFFLLNRIVSFTYTNNSIDTFKSWRLIFGFCGAIGIVFSVLTYILKEPVRDDGNIPFPVRALALKDTNVLKAVMRFSILLLIIAGIFYSFGNVGHWLIVYFERYKDFPKNDILPAINILIIITAISLILGGYISDLFINKNIYSNYYMIIAGIISSFIMALLLFYTNNKLFIKLEYCGIMFFASFIAVPSTILLLSLMKSKYRMTIFGIDSFLSQILWSSLGPIVMGGLSDKYNLRVAAGVLSIFLIVSAVFYALSGIYLSIEMKKSDLHLRNPVF